MLPIKVFIQSDLTAFNSALKMFNSCPNPQERVGFLWPLSQALWKILCTIQNFTCVSDFKPEQYQEYQTCYLLKMKNVPPPPAWSSLVFLMGTSMFLWRYFPGIFMGMNAFLLWTYQLQAGSSLPGYFIAAIFSVFSLLFHLCYAVKLTQHGQASCCVVIWLSNISLWFYPNYFSIFFIFFKLPRFHFCSFQFNF